MPKIIFSKELVADPTSKYAVYEKESWNTNDAILLQDGKIQYKEIYFEHLANITVVAIGYCTMWCKSVKDKNGNYHCSSKIDNLLVSSDDEFRTYFHMGLYETIEYKCHHLRCI